MERHIALKQCGKVLITGTHSTGKTTLAHHLTRDLSWPDVVVVPEPARNCPFRLNHAQNELSTTWLLAAQVKSEIEAQTRPGTSLVVCDRGVPDILAHHELSGADGLGSWPAVAVEWMVTYDRVFLALADPRHPMAPDELRLEDSEFRSDMAAAIERCLNSAGVPYEVLPHPLPGRIELIGQSLARAPWLP